MQVISVPPHLQHLCSYHGISSASRDPGSSCAFGIPRLFAQVLCVVMIVCHAMPGIELNGAERHETEGAIVQVSGLVEGQGSGAFVD